MQSCGTNVPRSLILTQIGDQNHNQGNPQSWSHHQSPILNYQSSISYDQSPSISYCSSLVTIAVAGLAYIVIIVVLVLIIQAGREVQHMGPGH